MQKHITTNKQYYPRVFPNQIKHVEQLFSLHTINTGLVFAVKIKVLQKTRLLHVITLVCTQKPLLKVANYTEKA